MTGAETRDLWLERRRVLGVGSGIAAAMRPGCDHNMTPLLNYSPLMEVDGGAIIDLLYTRGSFTAQHIAAEMGDGITTMDVSVQMMELTQQGLVKLATD
jgi:hypothetical protein